MANLTSLSYPSAEWSSIAAGGVLAMMNGLERNKVYIPESQTIEDMGMMPPYAECTAAEGGAGSLAAGTYVVSFIEADAGANQGNGLLGGPAIDSTGTSVVVVSENSSIDITFSTGAPRNARATQYWVYMSLADGAWPTLGRVATVDAGTQTYTITGASDPDFTNYPLDINRNFPRNKAYSTKMKRRLFTWGAQELRPTLQLEVGSDKAYYVSGDPIDEGSTGMVVYPDEDTRGYVIDSIDLNAAGSPAEINLSDDFVGSSASQDISNISCKVCRPSGELSWSEPDDYENFPLANVRYVELSASDPETGCATINGRGLFFTVRKTFGLNFQVRPDVGWGNIEEISTTIGCSSHRTILDIGGMLLWLSEGGIAASQGGAPQSHIRRDWS